MSRCVHKSTAVSPLATAEWGGSKTVPLALYKGTLAELSTFTGCYTIEGETHGYSHALPGQGVWPPRWLFTCRRGAALALAAAAAASQLAAAGRRAAALAALALEPARQNEKRFCNLEQNEKRCCNL